MEDLPEQQSETHSPDLDSRLGRIRRVLSTGGLSLLEARGVDDSLPDAPTPTRTGRLVRILSSGGLSLLLEPSQAASADTTRTTPENMPGEGE